MFGNVEEGVRVTTQFRIWLAWKTSESFIDNRKYIGAGLGKNYFTHLQVEIPMKNSMKPSSRQPDNLN